MRGAPLLLPLVIVVAALAPPAAVAHGECAGAPSAPVRALLVRVAGPSGGESEFSVNPRFACAEVLVRFAGMFPEPRPGVVEESSATVWQVVPTPNGTVETRWTVRHASHHPLLDAAYGLQPWDAAHPIHVAWSVTGVGELEFRYRGYPA